MFKTLLSKRFIAFFISVFCSLHEATQARAHEVEKDAREFVIQKVTDLNDGYFRIQFLEREGKRQKLFEIETKSRHASMVEGSHLTMQADFFEASQDSAVVRIQKAKILLNNGETAMPLWIFDRNFVPKQLQGTRLLDLHAPTSDFLIL